MPKLFGREPALWIAFIAAVLSIGTSVGIDGLSAVQAAAIVVVLNAVLGAVTAATVRPVNPAAFTYLVGAIAALAAAYGFDVSEQVVGAANAAVVSALALIFRGQVAPQETLVSRA